MKEKTLSPRIWFNLIMFGFMGQIAWNVENMYFNTFLYNSIYNGASQQAIDGSVDVMSAISLMVGLSAATAVLTTFLIGIISDKIGKRKVFITTGYIIWGIVTASFGFISKNNVSKIFNTSNGVKILTIAIALVITMDCVMTFVGSSANDACFNAWVTDVTNYKNRATTESVLAILPILAMGAVMGLAGVITKFGYEIFFIILGGVVTICGIVGIFTLKDSGTGVKKESPFFKEMFYGFKPSVVKEHKKLYLSFVAICIFNTAMQVFFPYIFIYISNGFEIGSGETIKLSKTLIIIAIVLLIAVISIIVFMGKMIDKFGKSKFIIVSMIIFTVGLFSAGFAHSLVSFIISMIPTLAGYILLLIMLNASIRDFTPTNRVGMFGGVRMIFYVLIPMVIGPLIGNLVCRFSAITYTNDYGVVTSAPGSVMFIASSIISLFLIIPVSKLIKTGFGNN